MYTLSLHIEYLLLRHDCVVMPGIGSFINIRHAAHYDSARGIWYPMTREVRFNRALTHDDGLLANSYARKNNLSFEEGRELLKRDLETAKEALMTDGEITIGNLGILKSENESLCFIPYMQASRLSSLLGYMPVYEEIETKIEPDLETETFIEPEAEGLVETEETVLPEEKWSRFDTEKNYYVAINKTFAKLAASFLLIAVIALAIILPVSDQDKVDRASVIPVEKIIHSEKTEITPAEPLSISEEEIVSSTQEEDKNVHAVVASFRKRSEAERFVSDREDCGYELEIIPLRKQSRVVALSATTREELSGMMKEGDFLEKFPRAWVWEE